MLDDSGAEIEEELVLNFLEESYKVMESLKNSINNFNDVSDGHLFEKFGQQIEPVMVSAYTLSLSKIGDLAKYGKDIGCKSGHLNDLSKLLVVHSLLSQLVRTLESILDSFKFDRALNSDSIDELLKRLSAANTQLSAPDELS